MASILDKIVAQKKLEIKELYQQYPHSFFPAFPARPPETPAFYQALAATRAAGKPFFITEFKRKSPSEGWINEHADLPAQVRAYARAGAQAISVLTDETFFGGAYEDLKLARKTIDTQFPPEKRPLLLQKEFILDPIQITLAKAAGADLILLIAAILEPDRLQYLRAYAESLGLGVLVEVHDAEELHRIQHLDFPVLGINSRDLKTFRTALNRVNVLAEQAGNRFIIAESGIKSYRDFQVVRRADGFLIGTGLMQKNDLQEITSFSEVFQAREPGSHRLLFKACGIRTTDALATSFADYLGVNFSPLSKRTAALPGSVAAGFSGPENDILQGTAALFDGAQPGAPVAGVFYGNSREFVQHALQTFPLDAVQLYSRDVTPEYIRTLRKKIFLACVLRTETDLVQLESYAADIDLFILDGAQPGSGKEAGIPIPEDFPYPFLLAGGLHPGNLERALAHPNCIGVDIASGIETDGRVDLGKIQTIFGALARINHQTIDNHAKT